MLAKTLTKIAVAALVASFGLSTAASAGGCNGGGHGLRVYHSTPSNNYAAQLKAKKAAQARAVAAAKRKKQIEIAQARAAQKARAAAVARAEAKAEKAEEVAAEAKAEKVEEIAEAAPVADSATADEVAVAAVDQTCSKFIPETGTTVTVECAQQ